MRAAAAVIALCLVPSAASAEIAEAKFGAVRSEAASVGRLSEMATRCAMFPGDKLVSSFVERNRRQGASAEQVRAIEAAISDAAASPREAGFAKCPPEPGKGMMTEELVKLWRGFEAER